MGSKPCGVGLLGSAERCFELGWRCVVAIAVAAVVVEPVHPRQQSLAFGEPQRCELLRFKESSQRVAHRNPNGARE